MNALPSVGNLRARLFGDEGTAVSDVGETLLLQILIDQARCTSAGFRDAIIVASGDDAAVVRTDPDEVLVVTQDAVVEDVDYDRRWTRPYLVGRRSLALSLSDIASMGAKAVWCMVTYCANPNVRYEDLVAIQQGLCDLASDSHCSVIGGDISRIDGPLVVDVVAAGTAPPSGILRRSAGQVGDALVVTGTLGRAAAGLRLLVGGYKVEPGQDTERWITSQLDPVARVEEGPALSQLGVECCGDLSDGLLIDAERTARSSDCAAEIWLEEIPVDPGLREFFHDEWLALALAGGEDFELLAAVPMTKVSQVTRSWSPKMAPLTVIGRLIPGNGVRLLDRKGGIEVSKPALTSRHF